MRHLIDIVENAPENILAELFDSEVRLKWRAEADMVAATFSIEDFRYSSVFVEFAPAEWEWAFELDMDYRKGKKVDSMDPMGVLGTGGAPRVFSAILRTLDIFMTKYSPDRVIFSAEEDSRKKLYAAMVRKLKGRLPPGYEVRFAQSEWEIAR